MEARLVVSCHASESDPVLGEPSASILSSLKSTWRMQARDRIGSAAHVMRKKLLLLHCCCCLCFSRECLYWQSSLREQEYPLPTKSGYRTCVQHSNDLSPPPFSRLQHVVDILLGRAEERRTGTDSMLSRAAAATHIKATSETSNATFTLAQTSATLSNRGASDTGCRLNLSELESFASCAANVSRPVNAK